MPSVNVLTIFWNELPMITAIARSTTEPFAIKALNLVQLLPQQAQHR